MRLKLAFAFILVFTLLTSRHIALRSVLAQGDPCVLPANEIVAENCQTGTSASQWDIIGAGSPDIQGFATEISVNLGDTVHFKIDTAATDYRLDIYRMGYYQGNGARLLDTIQPSAVLPQTQPACLTEAPTGLIDCGNWAESASWAVPVNAVSGIYFAKLVREDATEGDSHIYFIVRDDAGQSDLLFQTSDTTWQAYNSYGGNSLYVGGPGTNPGRAYKVSYNRPFITRTNPTEDMVFNAEYPMVRWLEANGYDVSYIAGADTARAGAELLEHNVFMSVGHDEYWSGAQRANVETARDNGVHLAFFSGNEIFWKTRWETSIDGSGTPYRTLVSYKETHAGAKIDPSSEWTGTWRDPRVFNPEGGRPENSVAGQIFTVDCCSYPMTVPDQYRLLRFWRNTDIATLGNGDTDPFPDGTVGYEWDEALDNMYAPKGLVRLSSTTVSVPEYIQDYGSTYAAGVATHQLVLSRKGDALVFAAGTVQWSWGLDSNHDRGNAPADKRMQQATVNLFADMGVQPATLQEDLEPATPSTDTTPPSATITNPTIGGTVQAGNNVTINGTAADSGGGVVGAVEVSTDNGATWRSANGYENWTFSWTPASEGTAILKARATDDSANTGSDSAPITVTVGPRICPCSIWENTPAVGPNSADAGPNELGVKFRATQAGYITGLKFYKYAANTGVHVGRLWTSAGVLLAEATFANESASGWQEVTLDAPIAIDANTTYVASYYTPTGIYAATDGYFATQGITNSPLRALQEGEDGHNGVYRYGLGGVFPTAFFESSNYWVDVIFDTEVGPDVTPPTVLATVPVNNAPAANVNASIIARFSEPINAATLNTSTVLLTAPGNVPVVGAVSYTNPNRTVTFTPSSPLEYSTQYTATIIGGLAGIADVAENALAADYVWTFTTSGPPSPPPDEGPGGPILVVGTLTNNFSRYYAEILRTEGLNAFTMTDISLLTPEILNTYDVVILGEQSLTLAQVSLFSDWVNAGGNLIAMRPDPQLATLLGLTSAGGTLNNGYLLVNTSSGPGVGIVNQTIQYHGVADTYTLNEATAIATLYSNASTSTANPAVTLRSVGTNGGQAAAFTFDLARSVVYTRQGNPAWAGQERDGIDGVRSDDLFFPDWIDLTKVAIPQADEQQRLLANLIVTMNLDKRPLPHFWYFPRGEKAVVVMTGDDHGSGSTVSDRFNRFIAQSPLNCSVENWECVRGSAYIYSSTGLDLSAALSYDSQGFDIGVHVNSNCTTPWTPETLNLFYDEQLGQFAARFPSLPAPTTNRTHCIAWSDFASQPQIELQHGIRLDTNYYYYPGAWLQDRPGMFTGSGMIMRFADVDGTMIDVFQAVTQMTDESGQSYPYTIDSLLDNALGPQGYYGAFTTNFHFDSYGANHPAAEPVVASALARGVPVVSAKQMLTWLDGRNNSSFEGLTWSNNTLAFTISLGAGANGLQAMLPTTTLDRNLTGITLDNVPVNFTLQTVKGITYAVFTAQAGSYLASYSDEAPTATPTPSPSPSLSPTPSSTPTPLGGGWLIDTTTTDFSAGTLGACSQIIQTNNGEVTLKPTVGEEFNGNALPENWVSIPWTGGTATVSGGQLNADGTNVTTTDFYSAGRSLEFMGTFRAEQYQHAGFGQSMQSEAGEYWAFFSTWNTTNTLYARTNVNGSVINTLIPGAWLGTPHRYRIDWDASAIVFSIDGTVVSTQNVSISQTMRPVISDFTNGAPTLSVDWLRMTPYATPCTFTSRVMDAINVVNWTTVAWISQTPVGTTLAISVRTGNTAIPDGNWTNFAPVTNGGNVGVIARYIQYQVDLATSDPALTPILEQIDLSYVPSNVTPTDTLTPSETGTPTESLTPSQSPTLTPSNSSTPSPTATPANLSTLLDTTTADFSAGTLGACSYVAETDNGEVTLKPTVGEEFSGNTLPVDWVSIPWTGGAATVSSGQLTVDGTLATTNTYYAAGRSIEFEATFNTATFQHIGFGQVMQSVGGESWAFFSTKDSTSQLFARTNLNGSTTDFALPGSWLGAPHRYRVDWSLTSIVFSIDGTVVYTQNAGISATMRPVISDFTNGGLTASVNWLHMTPYTTPCSFTSRVIDAGSVVNWNTIAWNSQQPVGTSLAISVRTGNTANPDSSWSSFASVTNGGTVAVIARYIQYQVDLATSDPAFTPILEQVAFTYAPMGDPATITPIPTATLTPSITPTSLPLTTLTDTTVADFSAGTTGACTVSQMGNGEVILSPTINAEFDTLPLTGWHDYQWTGGGASTISSGQLNVDGARFSTVDSYAVGQSAEFVATFRAATFQTVGFGSGNLTPPNPTFNDPPWAAFATTSTGSQVYARFWDGNLTIDIALGAEYLNTPHRYRIDWTATNVVYSVDGLAVHTQPNTINVPMRFAASDYNAGGEAVSLDWARITPYESPCTFTSRVFDAGATVAWNTLAWVAQTPAGTSLNLSVRTGNTANPDGTWTSFAPIINGGAINAAARYAQYQAVLSSSDPNQTPVLEHVTLTYSGISPTQTLTPSLTLTLTPSLTPTETPTTFVPLTLTDTTVVDFSAGTAGACTISQIGNGEVILTPSANAEFDTLPSADWTDYAWNPGGASTISSGQLNVDGARYSTNATFNIGQSTEFVTIFRNATFQNIGFAGGNLLPPGEAFSGLPWAVFGTANTGTQLYARIWASGGSSTDIPLGAGYLNTPHRYRIDWLPTQIVFSIDGLLVHTETVSMTTPMRFAASDFSTGGEAVSIDWVRVTPYNASCIFTSRVFDAGSNVNWDVMSWVAQTPANTSLTLRVRTGNTAIPDGSWTSFVTMPNGGVVGATSRYIQYEAQLSTTNLNQTPVLESVTFTTSNAPPVNTATLTSSPTYTSTSTETASPTATQSPTPTSSHTATATPRICPCSVWENTASVGVNGNDATAVELGFKFRATQNGYITALRFYKEPNNIGVHVGRLWTGTGTLLAEATYANESASGWQEVTLSPAVAITANTTYVATYHTTVGFYTFTGGYFNQTYDNPPLRALVNGEDGPNGVYRYGAGGVFPTDSFNASNYWVDVVYDYNAPTATPTNTASPSSTPSITPSLTSSATWTNTPSATATFTATASDTPTDTPTATSTDTATSTFTYTPSDTPTSTFTATFTDTPTATATDTATATFTFTPSDTPTSTFTATFTDTPTATATDTATSTFTYTPSDTPTSTFTATFTDTPTATATDTATSTFTYTPSDTPTSTFTATFTDTPTATATDTATSTFTFTPSDTPTSTFTATFTDTPTATATDTATSTFTYTPSDTPTSTFTATFTDTPTATATDTATSTFTYTPSDTPTSTFTATFTDTPTATATDTATATFTFTPSDTPTSTFTATFTDMPTATATDTATSTFTFTPSDTPTSTFTATFTDTPTATATDTATATFTYTPSDTPTSTFTATFTDTPTATFTYTPSDTPTSTFTATFTDTPTATSTDTATSTFTFTPSDTPTSTFTATFTDTPTATATDTATSTFTYTPSNTPTSTASVTMTATLTATASSTSSSTATPTNTLPPIVTATLLPTNTPSATATNTLLPIITATPLPTNTPSSTSTVTLTSTPTSTATQTNTSAPTLTFYRAINIGGPALVIDGNNWAANSGTTANFTTNGSVLCDQWRNLNPTTDANRTQMIRCYREHWAFNMAMTSVPTGTYVVYVYVWQSWDDPNAAPYNITIEGQTVVNNYNAGNVGGVWARLGPWTTTVTDGTLNLTTNGNGLADISGLEVYQLSSGVLPTTTLTPTWTLTRSVTPTATLTRTTTPTSTPSNTPLPASATITPTLTLTRTFTPTNLPSSTPTPTSTSSNTPLPASATLTPTLTLTRTLTPTSTPSNTLPASVTPTVTLTPSNTLLPATATLTPTNTPSSPPATATRMFTATGSPTATSLPPTATPTRTVTATSTRTLTPTVTRTPTPTATRTLTPATSAGFYRAYNLGGTAIVIDSHNWLAGTSGDLNIENATTLCNQSVTLLPATDANRATMIRCSITGTAPNIEITNIANGAYDVYLYIWEDNTPSTFSIAIQGGQVYVPNINSGAAGSWQRLGPYTINVSGGWMSIDTNGGQANLSGIELYSR